MMVRKINCPRRNSSTPTLGTPQRQTRRASHVDGIVDGNGKNDGSRHGAYGSERLPPRRRATAKPPLQKSAAKRQRRCHSTAVRPDVSRLSRLSERTAHLDTVACGSRPSRRQSGPALNSRRASALSTQINSPTVDTRARRASSRRRDSRKHCANNSNGNCNYNASVTVTGSALSGVRLFLALFHRPARLSRRRRSSALKVDRNETNLRLPNKEEGPDSHKPISAANSPRLNVFSPEAPADGDLTVGPPSNRLADDRPCQQRRSASVVSWQDVDDAPPSSSFGQWPLAVDANGAMQMEYRHKIRPVQLFVPSLNNPNLLRLNKNALNAVLGHASLANKKIVVISVAGAYRKGKSFLLNFFLEYLYILQYSQKNDVDMDWLQDETELEGFRHRPGAKRDTVGVWMWAEPIMIEGLNGERYAVVLIDTQGCFEQNSSSTSATNNNNHTTFSDSNNNNPLPYNNNSSWNNANKPNISSPSLSNHNSNYGNGYDTITGAKGVNCAALALSTMLSCVQIYNFAEFIPEEAINALQFFAEYGQLAASEAPQFGKPFQKLVMLVRDFKVSEELPYGFEGGAALLERALRQATVAGDGAAESDAAANLRQIRQHIRQCFNDGVSCCLMPHPGPKVADPTSTFHGHAKDIKPLFREEIRRFVESLVGPNLIKPKTINGTPITVRKFIECVREYGRMFESLEAPTPRAVLNTNIQLSCIDYALEAKIAYCRGMDRVTRSSRMMAEKKLLEAHIKHGIKALNIYDRCPKIASGDIRSQNLARLQESINHELERYKRLNVEKRVTTCASAMLACGDSALLGLGLGGAASGAVAASVVTLQLGIVSAGIVAIPVSLGALFGIWVYVTLKPTVRVCLGCERDA